jgi:hypothetical protein
MTKRPSARARIDWGAALAFFVALDPPRTRAAVARQFGVSEAAVRKHAIDEHWDDLAAEADMRAAEKALARAVKTREQRVSDLLRLTDRLIDHFVADDNFVAKAAEASFVDVERMAKLSELLLGEATDRIATSEVQQAFVVLIGLGPQLVAEGVAAGLKGEKLVGFVREEFPRRVQEQLAIAAGGGGDA